MADHAARFVDDAHRYSLDSRIATGGMGEVWRGTDTVLGREVAVKLLKAEYADDATFRSRFETEARHAASLHHPGVAAVFDFGEATGSEGGRVQQPYLVMELVNGQPLSALLASGRPLDPAVTADLLAQAADALGAAHAAGIVHRDVKPANLMVTPDRKVKITDFGIARAAEGMALTQTGQVMGTPQYLSPEQAQGTTATPASDVYSLGVVAFECLAGRRPFVAESAVATALAHLRDPVPELPSDVPPDLARVVRRSLSKDPAERFADGRAFAAALRDPAAVAAVAAAGAAADDATQVMGGAEPDPTPTVTTPVPPPVDPDADEDRRSPWLWILLALAVLAAIVVVALLAMRDDPSDTPTDEPTSRSPKPSETTSSATSQAPETVTVVASDYVGRDIKEVEGELRELGLKVTKDRLDNPGDEEENIVDSVDPTGDLEKGSTVTVAYWGKAAPPPESSTPPTPTDTTPTSPATESPSDQSPAAASASASRGPESSASPGDATSPTGVATP